MAATTDSVWRAQDTTPSEIEAALRDALNEMHRENEAYVPARVLNLVCVVDKAWSGEIANRLRRVGRNHASRTVVCAIEPRRDRLDAVAMIAAPAEPRAGELALLRETVVIDCGPQHLANLDSIIDPLMVTDLPTAVWAPHGHVEAIETLRDISQIVIVDSVDEPEPRAALARACSIARDRDVVDLAWLRSTPWRERLATAFDPPWIRRELSTISRVVVRHHPDSAAAGLLVLGWLGSRLGWRLSPLLPRNGGLAGRATGRRQDIELVLEPIADLRVPGLAGLEVETASGRWLRLDRGEGGLRARARGRRQREFEWTILGASRGEAGILGEGIRQALLRDRTYPPALAAATELTG